MKTASKCLTDLALVSSPEVRVVLLAANDLMLSVQIDTSTDGGESYTVLGNVDTTTLRILGFDIPEEKSR
jgi:hypothetical protein